MEFKIFQMEMFIEEITSMENLMEKVNIIGVVVLHIKENFWKDLEKEKGLGWVKLEINIMVILVEIERMDLDNIYGQMEILTKDNFVKIWEKEKDRWCGMMEVLIMESGKEAYLTEKVINIIFKLGIFKVKGEKPRVGYF